MIRKFNEHDLTAVMQIWLDVNIQAHHFIASNYWTENTKRVEEMLPQAEIYVFEREQTSQIEGFIGLTDNTIAGIFVKEKVQSNGIGKQLLDHVKSFRSDLALNVYQKNTGAVAFYQREQFIIQFENIDVNTGEREFVMTWKR